MAKDIEKQKAAQRRHYQENKEKYRERLSNRRLTRRDWVRSLKTGIKCEMCPENHPACLDFHHQDPAEKKANVARLVRMALSEEVILAEIKKCRVLCANCHRKLHWNGDTHD